MLMNFYLIESKDGLKEKLKEYVFPYIDKNKKIKENCQIRYKKRLRT